MRLVNGKFFDNNGNKVPIEFGNTEQIRLIELVEQARLEGIVPRYVFDGDDLKSMAFKCVCGGDIRVHINFDDGNKGDIIKCKGCDFSYKIFEDEDFEFPYFKLIV